MGLTAFRRLVRPRSLARLAAPHQNEGSHLAAGLRARTSADRSGARGKDDVPDSQRPTMRDNKQDPEALASSVGPLSILIPRSEGGAIPALSGARQKQRRQKQPHRARAARAREKVGQWFASRWSAGVDVNWKTPNKISEVP